MRTISGHCLCGAVRFEVRDAFLYAGFCHCSDCRRFSGSASSALAGLETTHFRLLAGNEALRHYRKSDSTVLGFCGTCGSSLYAAKPRRGLLHLRLGVLDEAPALRPQFHSHVGSKAAWDEICDGLPQYPAGRT